MLCSKESFQQYRCKPHSCIKVQVRTKERWRTQDRKTAAKGFEVLHDDYSSLHFFAAIVRCNQQQQQQQPTSSCMPTCPQLMDGPSELDFGDWQHPAPTESFQAPALPAVSNAGYPGQLTSSAFHLQQGPSEPQPRRIPGPAGRAPGRGPSSRQRAGLAGATAAPADADFLAQPWQAALSCLDLDDFDERHPFLQNTVRTATTLAKSAKLARFVAVVVTLQRTYSGQAFIRLKDPTGAIGGTISKQALDDEPGIQPGSVLILEEVTVLRLPSLRPLHHICITLENIAQVVPAAPVASQQQISSQRVRPPALGVPMLPAPLSAIPPTQPVLPSAHFQREPAWGSEQPAGSGRGGSITAPSALSTSQTCSGICPQYGVGRADCGSQSQNHHAQPRPAVTQQQPGISAPNSSTLFVQPGRSALQQCNSQLTGGEQQQEQHKPAARLLQAVQVNSQPLRQGVSQRSEVRERGSLQEHQPHQQQQPQFLDREQPATSHTSQFTKSMQLSQGQQSSHHMGPPPPRLGLGMGAHDRQQPGNSRQGLLVSQPMNQPPHEQRCQHGSAKPLGQVAARGTAWLQGLLQELPPTDDFGCSQATQSVGQPMAVKLPEETAAAERDAKRSRVEECPPGAEAGFGDGIDELMAGLEDELGL